MNISISNFHIRKNMQKTNSCRNKNSNGIPSFNFTWKIPLLFSILTVDINFFPKKIPNYRSLFFVIHLSQFSRSQTVLWRPHASSSKIRWLMYRKIQNQKYFQMKRLFNFDRSNISKELKIIQMEFLASITKFFYSSLFLQLTSKN